MNNSTSSDQQQNNCTLFINRFMRNIDRCCLFSGIAFMLLMITCVAIQIVARYGFDSPPAWTEELGRYAMIWSVMLGATSAYYRRADPAIFAWDEQASQTKKLIRQVLETLAVIIFICPVLYYSPSTLVRHISRDTETLEISSALVFSIIPIAFSIILFYALMRMIVTLIEYRNK